MTTPMKSLAIAVLLAVFGFTGAVLLPADAAAPSLRFEGRTVTVADPPAAQERAKFYDVTSGTVYLGQDVTAPFSYALPAQVRTVEVRLVSPDLRLRATVPDGTTPTATPTPTPSPTAPPGSAVVDVSTPAQLQAALAAAQAGQTIRLANGTYDSDAFGRWTAAADGTPAAPITLTGSRAAILTADGPTGDYGLHITGDHWRVTGLTVAQASKGIVMDTAQHVSLSNIEVHTIGDEGVHFRWCSADGVLTGSYVHDTGLRAPRFGEGVYVGSANSNWSKYACADGRDNSERVLVENNVFRNIAAEGADLKEGTESGTLRGNIFDNTGFSGENSADSAVDAKGNNWLIEGNTVRNSSGAFLDAFQTHSVYSGYGTGNVFRSNTVEGPVPGFGFGLYPALGNTARCDNAAPGATKGLVGANGNPAACTP